MTTLRDPKAFRIHMEQIERRLRNDAEREAAARRREELYARAAEARRQAERLEQQAAAIA